MDLFLLASSLLPISGSVELGKLIWVGVRAGVHPDLGVRNFRGIRGRSDLKASALNERKRDCGIRNRFCYFRHLNGKTANTSRSRMDEHNIPLSNMKATVKRAISS
jgi:hypothetical protein